MVFRVITILHIPFLKKSVKKSGWRALVRTGGDYLLAGVQVAPDGVRVVQVEAFAITGNEALAQVTKQADLAACRLVTLLAAGEYQVLHLEAPQVPREEWKQALGWKLQDLIDFPVEQACFDVLDIPTEAYAPGRPAMAYAVVARKELVQGLMQSFADTGLEAIDIPETALRNISARLESENRGLACLHFDLGGGLLVVTYKGELYASRRIEISLEQLALADMERKQQLFERIGLELQRSLDAFDRQYSFITVPRLLIAPRPELGGLLDYLATTLYLPVESLDLGQALDLSACPELQQPQQQSRFLLAIGAALRDAEGGKG